VDVRRTRVAARSGQPARLFVASGTIAMRETKDSIARPSPPGRATARSPRRPRPCGYRRGAAELFASALVGNRRADLIGEHTIGRAAQQKLVKLPDGSGLWLTTTRYLTPAGEPLHEKGLEPTVLVDQPDVEFGQPAPADDPVLDKALERVAAKKAA
jgi:carboxyl-terminal processing protease